MRFNVAVIGQGYVGLPLALAAAESGFKVLGFDVDTDKVEKLNEGISPIEGLSESALKIQLNDGRYIATSDAKLLDSVAIYVICVPTPLDSNSKPDLTHVNAAIDSIADFITAESLIVLESTVAPQTTRLHVLPEILKKTRLSANEIDLVFSPERIDPGNSYWNIRNTPKLISGTSKKAISRAKVFYSKFIENLYECESLEVAEVAKLLENSFRLVNISLVNEISIFCAQLGVDVNRVIDAASTKPYGFTKFSPSIGAGGHCIPVDPVYLLKKSIEVNTPITSIDVALKINHEMPLYFVDKAEEILVEILNKRILVIGLAYKPNISDLRESSSLSLISGLRRRGAKVFWHDDLVKQWNSEESVPISGDFDLAILATPHDYLDLAQLGDVPILNTRGSI